jgi:hypothetical protein
MEPLNLHRLNISSLNPAAICFLDVDCRQYPRVPSHWSARGGSFRASFLQKREQLLIIEPLAHGMGHANQSMARRICGLPPTRSMLAIASATKATQGSVDFNTAIVAAGSIPHQVVDE